ncbi:MAG: penicillin-binding protein 1C, partial [Gammaproteobacteria bacterium]|nr:penicillin-binding protein 1C [Gammaproteobacteria bacterium]
RRALPFNAPHFVESYLRRYDTEHNHTTLDLKLQKTLERNIRQYIERNRQRGVYNASALLVDYRDMSIRAMVGSADYFNDEIRGQVNGTAALRSPGSTLKPFIYALAMQQGLLHSQSMLRDAPRSFGAYNPENYDQDFKGPITVSDALIKSRNIPAVATAAQLNKPDLYDFLQLAGANLPESKQHYGLSLVLGGAEVTMQTLVRLYAMLANRGRLHALRWQQQEADDTPVQLLDESASYVALKMLGGNPRPGRSYKNVSLKHHLPVYWKTGTSYGFRDAWSIGVFGPYVLAVWVGNFQGDGNPVLTGRRVAGPLLFRIIDAIHTQTPAIAETRIFKPDSVKRVKVCALSGDIANKYCHVKEHASFIPGVSPIKKCTVHRQIYVDSRTGLRACKQRGSAKAKIYEFWPSDLLAVFRQAGIARRIPPPFESACKEHNYTVAGLKPRITSPVDKVTYIYRSAKADNQTIAFSAVTDADVQTLYWFINESFLGIADAKVPYYWQSYPGNYKVRVIDDHGRSDFIALTVHAGQ